jgi:predicted transcriptional regulator
MAEADGNSIYDIPSDEAGETAADAAARADIAAGQFVQHADVVRWLRSWGKPGELPCPLPPSSE